MGDVGSATSNPVMEAELALQSDTAGSGRGSIVLLPTVVINLDQYRGWGGGVHIVPLHTWRADVTVVPSLRPFTAWVPCWQISQSLTSLPLLSRVRLFSVLSHTRPSFSFLDAAIVS